MKRLLKLFGMVFVGIGAGGAVVALAFTGLLPVPLGPLGTARAQAEQARPPVTVMYPTSERIVNLADTAYPRYLKTRVTLEFIDHARKDPPRGEAVKEQQIEFANDMSPHQPIIEDGLTLILSSKASSDLLNPAGKERLKQEIISQMNTALHEQEQVVNVYFTTFIVQ